MALAAPLGGFSCCVEWTYPSALGACASVAQLLAVKQRLAENLASLLPSGGPEHSDSCGSPRTWLDVWVWVVMPHATAVRRSSFFFLFFCLAHLRRKRCSDGVATRCHVIPFSGAPC